MKTPKSPIVEKQSQGNNRAGRERRLFIVIFAGVAAIAVLIGIPMWYFGQTETSIRDLRSEKAYKRAISAWRLGLARESSERALRGLINLLDDRGSSKHEGGEGIDSPEYREYLDYLGGVAPADIPPEALSPDTAAEGALLRIGKPAVDVLVDTLNEEGARVDVRVVVAGVLVRIDDPRSVPAVTEAILHSDDATFRSSAFMAMGRHGGHRVIPSLMRCLESHEDLSHVDRALLVFWMGETGELGVQPLAPFLRHPNSAIRELARESLHAIARRSEHSRANQVLQDARQREPS